MSARGKRPEQLSPEVLARYCGPACRGGPRCGGCVERARRDRRAAEEAAAAAVRALRESVRPLEQVALSAERSAVVRVESTDARRIEWALRLERVRRYAWMAS
jgi:hypothetical protein